MRRPRYRTPRSLRTSAERHVQEVGPQPRQHSVVKDVAEFADRQLGTGGEFGHVHSKYQLSSLGKCSVSARRWGVKSDLCMNGSSDRSLFGVSVRRESLALDPDLVVES